MPKRKRISRYVQQERDAQSESPTTIPRRIPADISKQAPHTSWGAVPLYYEDKEFRCIDCGQTEVWTAEQQKWSYEVAKGYIFSRAIRCHACRKRIRDQHGGTPRKSHQERQAQQTNVAETPVAPAVPQHRKRSAKRRSKYPRYTPEDED